MAIFDIFKKKKRDLKSTKRSKEEIFNEKPVKPVKAKSLAEKKFGDESKVRSHSRFVSARKGEAYKILKTPHITEKAGDLTAKRQYVFKVWPNVDKNKIKKAVEGLYGVGVVSVKIINVLPKKRRLGKISGWTKGYKKAIIKIEKDQKIELLPR